MDVSQAAGEVVLDPVLMGSIKSFEAYVERLRSSQEHSCDTGMRLCEISRDVRLRLGRPSESPKALTRRIVRLFRKAVKLIGDTCPKCADYRKNIADRASIIERDAAL